MRQPTTVRLRKTSPLGRLLRPLACSTAAVAFIVLYVYVLRQFLLPTVTDDDDPSAVSSAVGGGDSGGGGQWLVGERAAADPAAAAAAQPLIAHCVFPSPLGNGTVPRGSI